jgi:hypothetical protein
MIMNEPVFNKHIIIQHWITMADNDYDAMMD